MTLMYIIQNIQQMQYVAKYISNSKIVFVDGFITYSREVNDFTDKFRWMDPPIFGLKIKTCNFLITKSTRKD